MDAPYKSEEYKLDYKISQSRKLTINIQSGILSTSFYINNLKKISIDTWQSLRDSKNGRLRYDNVKIEQKGYNITIVIDEDYKIGYYQYIKSIDGILEMGIIYGYNNEEQNYSSIIKIPIEYCYDILDKIIAELSNQDNTSVNTSVNTNTNTN